MRPLFWVASSKKDLKALPSSVQDAFGFALFLAQSGEKHDDAKPLNGFGGASVLEVVENLDGDTFRAVYTVRYAEAVYVLHAFQKKSKSGKATSKQDIELIKARLKLAEQEYTQWQKTKKNP